MSRLSNAVLQRVRELENRTSRRDGRRRVLVDARTPVNYVVIAPVVKAMSADPRVEFVFTASEEPRRAREIYSEAPGVQIVHPLRAAGMKFDAYVASDFMWARLLRGTCRIQVFHGVAGKYGFDAPTTSMRQWHRLFFINRRRLRNYIEAGAIDADSPAIRLVGYPKVDCIVDGSLQRDVILADLGLDPTRPTILYAPTRSAESSLNKMGEEVIARLLTLGTNLIVKLHDRSRDLRESYSGGVDWVSRLQPLLPEGRALIAPHSDISPYLVAADVMVTDHSSAGFEFLLRDRPIVRIHCPELLRTANVHPAYAHLLASVSQTVETPAAVLDAVDRGLQRPFERADDRRRVAEDLFHLPGSATARAAAALYEILDLDQHHATPATQHVQEETCQRSA
ncbi:MAG: CDP-glycerol glycerophosphotransferase family protein [Acidobacteriota bacterium]|nr:CDP-glycerol glycerophosphotransferase family protein [Acidobacteriota bacterium]